MQPDLEIYLKKVATEDVLDWLEDLFTVKATRHRGQGLEVSLDCNGRQAECVIVERAVKGGYTSLWFKQNVTPWPDDEACARAAFERFSSEIRCSTGSWTEHDEDRGGWYRFTDDGRSVVNWLA